MSHPDNTWADCLTLDELRRIWRPEAGGVVMRWSQVRDGWPDHPLLLYAPGRDSGTFDYFTSAVVGEEGVSRGDFVGSEDDYLLAQDVAAHPSALGFFGYAYYSEYRDRLKLLAIDAGRGCVAPDAATIEDGSYHPLSRPLSSSTSPASSSIGWTRSSALSWRAASTCWPSRSSTRS